MKIRPLGIDLFYADGETNRHDEANSRFPQFCERDKKKQELSLANNEVCLAVNPEEFRCNFMPR
jgi:hypothetical protein